LQNTTFEGFPGATSQAPTPVLNPVTGVVGTTLATVYGNFVGVVFVSVRAVAKDPTSLQV
jgi:hypothetical protein